MKKLQKVVDSGAVPPKTLSKGQVLAAPASAKRSPVRISAAENNPAATNPSDDTSSSKSPQKDEK